MRFCGKARNSAYKPLWTKGDFGYESKITARNGRRSRQYASDDAPSPKMQEDMARTQADLEQRTYEATVGGGAVTAKVSGTHEVLSINIKPEVVDPDDVEMLSDLVMAAVNEAIRQAIATSEEEMSKITGGLNLPGMF